MLNTVMGSTTQHKPSDMAQTLGLQIMLLIFLEKLLMTNSKGIVILDSYYSQMRNSFRAKKN